MRSYKTNVSNNMYFSVENRDKDTSKKLILHNNGISAKSLKEIGVSIEFENLDSGDSCIRFNRTNGTEIRENKKYSLSKLSSYESIEAGGTKEIILYIEEGFNQEVKLVVWRNNDEPSTIEVRLSNDGE